jgi:hypothetical protein
VIYKKRRAENSQMKPLFEDLGNSRGNRGLVSCDRTHAAFATSPKSASPDREQRSPGLAIEP